MDNENTAKTAEAGLAFLQRVELKGAEVGAYIEVNQLLGRIANGESVVVVPENNIKEIKQ
jgi:hypothetical protein